MSLPVKAFIEPDGRTSIVCPDCGFSKLIPFSELPRNHRLLKIRCKCNHYFKVQIEARKSFRRQTELRGVFIPDGKHIGRLGVIVVNVSLSGVRFELQGYQCLSVGDRGTLNFTLDDRKKSAVTKQLIVKSISNKSIGCEFIEDTAYRKELGFYLLR